MTRFSTSVLLFFSIGLLVFSLLFLTVHNRSATGVQDEQFNFVIQWAEQGFLNLGGMRFGESVDDNPATAVKTTIPQTFLYPSLVLQEIAHALHGSYSKRVMALYNQAVIWVGASLLGTLAFLLLRQGTIPLVHSIILATIGQVLYQTFPWNLVHVYRLYPSTFLLIWLFALLIVFVRNEALFATQKHSVAQAILSFLIVYSDHTIGFFFFAAIIIFRVIGLVQARYRSIFAIGILPALAGFGLFRLQALYVQLMFPEITKTGSGILYRTGLDGSTTYYTDMWGILARNSYVPVYMSDLGSPHQLSNWAGYFAFGIFSTVVLLFALWKHPKYFQTPFLAIGTILVTGILYSCILSQTIITHPFIYDVIIFSGLTLSSFVALPIATRLWLKDTATTTLVLSMIGLFFIMAQLRSFAVAFPVADAEPWIPLGF